MLRCCRGPTLKGHPTERKGGHGRGSEAKTEQNEEKTAIVAVLEEEMAKCEQALFIEPKVKDPTHLPETFV